ILNIDIKQYLHLFEFLEEEQGRGRIIKLSNNITIIDDAYNAGPASMKAALHNIKNYTKSAGRYIAILGDMRELGDMSKNYHLDLKDVILSADIDKVYLVGEWMQYLYKELPDNIKGGYYKDFESIKLVINEIIKPDDVVLLK